MEHTHNAVSLQKNPNIAQKWNIHRTKPYADFQLLP